MRALIEGGFADLHHPEHWDLGWVAHSPLAEEYRRMVTAIGDGVRFMETLSGQAIHNADRVDFYTSHEALLLHYEQALTRQVPRQWGWFNLSTHFPWIGMRTADLDGAHIEYMRGIRNPVAVKIGPSVKPEQLMRVVDALNPDDEPGRMTLIHRMGAAKVADALPPLLDTIKREGRKVLWVADPMHGNTESVSNGVKTRRFENIRSELYASTCMPRPARGWVACTWNSRAKTSPSAWAAPATSPNRTSRAPTARRSIRALNYEQSLELAMRIVRKRGAAV